MDAEEKKSTLWVVLNPALNMMSLLRYVARFAEKAGMKIGLFYAPESTEILDNLLIGKGALAEDRRRQAETFVQNCAQKLFDKTNTIPIVEIREGPLVQELQRFLKEQKKIGGLFSAIGQENEQAVSIFSALIEKKTSHIQFPLFLIPDKILAEDTDHSL